MTFHILFLNYKYNIMIKQIIIIISSGGGDADNNNGGDGEVMTNIMVGRNTIEFNGKTNNEGKMVLSSFRQFYSTQQIGQQSYLIHMENFIHM